MGVDSAIFASKEDFIIDLLKKFDRFPEYRNWFFAYPDEQMKIDGDL